MESEEGRERRRSRGRGSRSPRHPRWQLRPPRHPCGRDNTCLCHPRKPWAVPTASSSRGRVERLPVRVRVRVRSGSAPPPSLAAATRLRPVPLPCGPMVELHPVPLARGGAAALAPSGMSALFRGNIPNVIFLRFYLLSHPTLLL